MRYGILFDLDGTLLDTLEDLADGTNYALGQFSYPRRTLEEVRQFVGNGARRLIQQAVPAGVDAEPVLAVFQAYYSTHCRIKTKAYDGIQEAMDQLGKRYPIAIVSNKPDRAVKPLCGAYFPGVYAQGECDGCPRKPAPDMVCRAMEAIGAETCVYVGDSEVDVLTARNAGVPCLSVLWGFRDRETIAAAGGTYFCQSPRELAAAVEEIIRREESASLAEQTEG